MRIIKTIAYISCLILMITACSFFDKENPKTITTYLTTLGGNGFDIATDVLEADDGYIVAGAVGPQCDIVDAMIAKVDKESGATISMRTFGNPNQGFEENFFSLTKIGNSYRAVGFTKKPQRPDENDCGRASGDLDGKMSYAYIDEDFENSFYDTLEHPDLNKWDSGLSISESPGGKTFITGTWKNRIALIEIEGNAESVTVINDIRNSETVGDGRELLYHSNGRTYIAGKWHSSVAGFGNYRAYFGEVDFANEALINEHFYEFFDLGKGGWLESNLEDVVELPNGDIFIVGVLTIAEFSDQQIFYAILDQDGNEKKSSIIPLGFNDDADDLLLLDDGIIITGKAHFQDAERDGDMLIAKLDFDGNIMWKSCIDYNQNSDNSRAIIQTEDGGFLIVGRTTNSDTNIKTMIMAKTDAQGKIEGLDCECRE